MANRLKRFVNGWGNGENKNSPGSINGEWGDEVTEIITHSGYFIPTKPLYERLSNFSVERMTRWRWEASYPLSLIAKDVIKHAVWSFEGYVLLGTVDFRGGSQDLELYACDFHRLVLNELYFMAERLQTRDLQNKVMEKIKDFYHRFPLTGGEINVISTAWIRTRPDNLLPKFFACSLLLRDSTQTLEDEENFRFLRRAVPDFAYDMEAMKAELATQKIHNLADLSSWGEAVDVGLGGLVHCTFHVHKEHEKCHLERTAWRRNLATILAPADRTINHFGKSRGRHADKEKN